MKECSLTILKQLISYLDHSFINVLLCFSFHSSFIQHCLEGIGSCGCPILFHVIFNKCNIHIIWKSHMFLASSKGVSHHLWSLKSSPWINQELGHMNVGIEAWIKLSKFITWNSGFTCMSVLINWKIINSFKQFIVS